MTPFRENSYPGSRTREWAIENFVLLRRMSKLSNGFSKDPTDKKREWSNFREFLGSESKLYWITGKPGSGKSTLMKYISHPPTEPRYMKHLLTWATDSKLIVANFYFWNSGLKIQMSIRGLLLSLLRQLLTNDLAMIPVISPTRWESLCLFSEDDDSLSDFELENMLRLFVQHLPTKTKVFFLIDGLDEFDGNHQRLASFLVALLHSPNIKMCVASRPWTVFEETFQQSASLMLQDLTRDDIRLYVTSTMVAEPTFSLLQKREPHYADELIEHIVFKASGVFLWVNLVVQSLLAGIGYGDRIADLQRRLGQLPPDLENLYDRILSSMDPFYLEHAAQLFQIFESFDEPPTVLLMAFADEQWRHAIDRAIRPMSEEEVETTSDTMRRRINSRTKGFLEVSKKSEDSVGGNQATTRSSTVQYLHRTVRDYIKSQTVQDFLTSAMKSSFDLYLQLCTAYLLQIKCLRGIPLSDQDKVEQLAEFMRPLRQHPYDCVTTGIGLFWPYLSFFLKNASKIHLTNSAHVVSLMEEMDKTGSALSGEVAKLQWVVPGLGNMDLEVMKGIDTRRLCYLDNGMWVHLFPKRPNVDIGGDFLSLAVRYGVVPYVRAEAKPGCVVKRQPSRLGSGARSLLFDALTTHSEADVGRPWAVTVPSPSMVNCLLDMGADIDWGLQSADWYLRPFNHKVFRRRRFRRNKCAIAESPWYALFETHQILNGPLDHEDPQQAFILAGWKKVYERILQSKDLSVEYVYKWASGGAIDISPRWRSFKNKKSFTLVTFCEALTMMYIELETAHGISPRQK